MTSRDAAAALMCRLGCFTDDEQSRARANVPTDRAMTKNFSISESVNLLQHSDFLPPCPLLVSFEIFLDGTQIRSSRSGKTSPDSSELPGPRSSLSLSLKIGGTMAWYWAPILISPWNFCWEIFITKKHIHKIYYIRVCIISSYYGKSS